MDESEIYCPVCGRTIKAINPDEVERGEHDGYIFVHDEIPHDISDIYALEYLIQ